MPLTVPALSACAHAGTEMVENMTSETKRANTNEKMLFLAIGLYASYRVGCQAKLQLVNPRTESKRVALPWTTRVLKMRAQDWRLAALEIDWRSAAVLVGREFRGLENNTIGFV